MTRKEPLAPTIRSRTRRDTELCRAAWDAVMKAARESRHARRTLSTAIFHLLQEQLPGERADRRTS
jgi:hypothetical protein